LEDTAVEALKSLYQPVERDIDDIREKKTIAHADTIKPLRAEK